MKTLFAAALIVVPAAWVWAGATVDTGTARTAAPAAAPGPAYLKQWDTITATNNVMRRSKGQVLRIVASNGMEAGVPLTGAYATSLTNVEALLKTNNLLDPERLYDVLKAQGLDAKTIGTVDTLCWDLVARTQNKPLHAVWGTKQQEIALYGDVRRTEKHTPETYAQLTKEICRDSNLVGVKLHFPGNSGNQTLPVDTCIAYLRAVRKAVGPDPMLAWDPHPGEAATNKADAMRILKVMEEEKYEWLEGPIPPGPEATQIPLHVEICKETTVRIEPEGTAADGKRVETSSLEAMQTWAKAGACDQWHYDVLTNDGITQALRMMRFAEKWSADHPQQPLRINLHWAWTPQQHLIAAFDKSVAPYYENPYREEVPKDHQLPNGRIKAATWPGVYQIDGLNGYKIPATQPATRPAN